MFLSSYTLIGMKNTRIKNNQLNVYKVMNTLNGKIYIGITIYSLSHRKGQHYQDLKKKNSTSKFARALKKYPREVFTWEVIWEASSEEEMIEKEIYFIQLYDTLKNGYNIRSGGEGGGKHSEETRHNHSLRMSGENHPMYGKKRTHESIQQSMETRRNNGIPWVTEEAKKNISKGKLGKKVNEEGKINIKNARNLRLLGVKYKPKEKKFNKICSLCQENYKAADIRSKICPQCKKPKLCVCGCKKLVTSPGRFYSTGCDKRGKTYKEMYGDREVKCGFQKK